MFRQILRNTAKAGRLSNRVAIGRATPAAASTRDIHSSAPRPESSKDTKNKHEGQSARTDPKIQVEYPAEGELPDSTHVQGRGGLHFKRTLPSFSLEGRVGVVTGGARGLGLVMAQAMVISGANIAIVDLNSVCRISGGTRSKLTMLSRGGRYPASKCTYRSL